MFNRLILGITALKEYIWKQGLKRRIVYKCSIEYTYLMADPPPVLQFDLLIVTVADWF